MSYTEWQLSRRPGEVRWTIVRIIKCRVMFHTHDPSQWTRDLSLAFCYSDREEAFQNARAVGGLLVIQDA